MNSMIKQKLSPDKLKNIFIQMDGQKRCAEGKIEINEIQMLGGIKSVELILVADKNPEVVVKYHSRIVNQETADALGLKKGEDLPPEWQFKRK